MTPQFQNRTQAGELLATKLTAYAKRPDAIVLGLPRGGVPVAFEVAKTLNVPLDIILVRKLGAPAQPELAMGAIATGGVLVLNDEVVNWLGIPQAEIDAVAQREMQELERRDRLYRGNCPLPHVENRTVILVDDGIATGSTLRAAIAALRQQQPQQIIVAVPIAPASVCQQLRSQADDVVCAIEVEQLSAISLWYEEFTQTSDEEVRALLAEAANSYMALFLS
ncbi:phosphoribosyl transferase [Chroococcidiopsis sp. CCALA 051]|uniref:phosphoribosyltransferase n=1 Tax=Chroococcidiopsis sp. CCALA 051 TaxID=869949 RepID=UPI000D0C9DCB|nr:phosphoribosyltransferase [Chroococcidiopsis sp. CCALA 051]MBE9014770.1 phosphoribosyltransferase [Chroococcidiopsidales cyanobacterium LEGE 13417]PSM47087.1 phosphoribosyl transferase [Chroococcidiopsis sp. CCALA 051]